jgi:hypothetical protein
MAKGIKFHERKNKDGWPVFTANQTDIRIALCRKALCPDKKMVLRFKDCYQSDAEAQKLCKTGFLSEEYFDFVAKDLRALAWGGKCKTPECALEGGFYPFIRCVKRVRPIDVGIIWIGTRHEYPRIWVDNMVATWLCPYSKGGHVMVEPFEPLHQVLDNWARLSDRRFFPFLDLPPVPEF